MVDALQVFDDGLGPALYAGGLFYAIVGGVESQHIATWGPLEQTAHVDR